MLYIKFTPPPKKKKKTLLFPHTLFAIFRAIFARTYLKGLRKKALFNSQWIQREHRPSLTSLSKLQQRCSAKRFPWAAVSSKRFLGPHIC